MRRALSVSLPEWSVDLARRKQCPPGEERPILLARTTAGRRLVERSSREACELGVREGMSIAEASALLGSEDAPRVFPFEPDQDLRALKALAQWVAIRFSPVVALDPPDGLLVDIFGCDRLFGGERRLIESLSESLGKLRIHAHCAAANTIGCAWAVARFGSTMSVPAGLERETLAALPIEALRVCEETVRALDELGFRCIGELYELPRKELPARFAPELLIRLDQALGSALETAAPIRPQPPPVFAFEFEGAVTRLEVILMAMDSLTQKLGLELEKRQSGVRKVSLSLSSAKGPVFNTEIALSRPSRDTEHIATLLAAKLERTSVHDGIVRIDLRGAGVEPLRPVQAPLTAELDDAGERVLDEELGRLVDALTGRLGEREILCAEVCETYLPEEAFRLKPFVSSEKPRAGRLLPYERPSTLFPRPEPLRLEVSGGTPSFLEWRDRRVRVVSHSGPERLAAPWWRREDADRDYYRMHCDSGRLLWVFRDSRSRRWFAHGEWT